MKNLLKFLFFAAVVAGVVYVLKQIFAPPDGESAARSGVLPSQPVKSLDDAPLGGKISEELLKILVCPEDKGPLELVDDGKFLLNPRNGYKYPIRNGIPVMLIEEGKKYRDPNFTPKTDSATA
ncbi:MAG: Trm112 family protein [Caldilinea sp.]